MSGSPDLAVAAPAGTQAAQAFWQRYFRFYDTLNNSIPYRRMIDRQVELLSPAAGEAILDAGTGTGNVAVELLARGARVTGIDFCVPALDVCRAKCPGAAFVAGDLTRRLDFADAAFDKIACSCVLHVLDRAGQEQAAHELFRLLKPGGTIVLTVFALGFSPWQVYRETLRAQRRVSGFAGTVGFGLRYSLDTARIIYYVSRIQRRERRGVHDFFTAEALVHLVVDAGFAPGAVETTFARQCLLVTACRPPAADAAVAPAAAATGAAAR